MRLRFFTSTPLNIAGGSGTYVAIQTLTQALRDLGVVVELVTPMVRFPHYTTRRLLFNEMLRFRHNRGFDLTVGFDMDGYGIASKNGAPHVAAIKGVIADELQHERGFTRATMAVQAHCEAMHVRRATMVMTTSRYAASRLEQLYGVKVDSIVPELIDLSRWRRLFHQNPAPKRAGFVVLSVCRLYRRKRIELLLRAAARLRTAIPELEVRVVGMGPERARLQAIWQHLGLENTVRFLGDVTQSQLAAEYNGCDLFCLPSVQEGFGIVFLEAMAAQRPIIAARAAAVPEVVQHGILVPRDDEQALAEAIEKLYRDRQMRDSLAQAGAAFVECFDAPRVARSFLSEIEKVCRPR